WLGFKPDLRLNEGLSFAILMPVIFGAAFQTPVAMMLLFKLGVVGIDSFRNRRRVAWLVMGGFPPLLTPPAGPDSMLFLWVPMGLLFELGIVLMRLSPVKAALSEEGSEMDELAEV